jgi:hypothetical protein
MALNEKPSDPPMEPLDGSVWWLSSEANVITRDSQTATLVIRLELALNALEALPRGAVHDARYKDQSPVERMRGVFLALLTYGGFVREAVNILTGTGGKNPSPMQLGQLERVTELARMDGVSPELDKTIRQICGGSHPACSVLTTLRNKVGFHWDPELLHASVLDFARNGTIVWAEAPEQPPESLVHRLAIDVAANALFPDSKTELSAEERERHMQQRITTSLNAVDEAAQAIIRFFSHAVKGYFSNIGVRAHARDETRGAT